MQCIRRWASTNIPRYSEGNFYEGDILPLRLGFLIFATRESGVTFKYLCCYSYQSYMSDIHSPPFSPIVSNQSTSNQSINFFMPHFCIKRWAYLILTAALFSQGIATKGSRHSDAYMFPFLPNYYIIWMGSWLSRHWYRSSCPTAILFRRRGNFWSYRNWSPMRRKNITSENSNGTQNFRDSPSSLIQGLASCSLCWCVSGTTGSVWASKTLFEKAIFPSRKKLGRNFV